MHSILEILLYSVMWAMFGLISGWLGHRCSPALVERSNFLLKSRNWEHRGWVYQRRTRVSHWKDRLPEGGDFFAGGVSKAMLPGRSITHLRSFRVETLRAELVHWANVVFGATFLLWTEPPIGVVMTIFGVVVHGPFILEQRFNRARLEYLVARASTPRLARPGTPRNNKEMYGHRTGTSPDDNRPRSANDAAVVPSDR